MELAWIDDFIALDRTRNFTSAANIRNSTQSAFSRRIKMLENWMDVQLFSRDTRPVKLTHAGQSCKKRIYRLRDDIIDMKRIASLAPSNMPHNTPVIYTTNTIAIGFLPQWIKDNNIDNYRLVISSITRAIEAVNNNECDYTILPRFKNANENSVLSDAMKVYEDELIFMGECTIKNNMITSDMVMYAPGTILGHAINNIMKQHNLKLLKPPICESASAEAVLAQIKNGLGAGWVIRSILLQDDQKQINTTMPIIPFELCIIEGQKRLSTYL